MRDDIIDSRNGNKVEINIAKAISPAFYPIWFTNIPKARYVIAMGARNTGKSKSIIGYMSIMKIISNPKRNILVFRKNDIDNKDSTFKNICSCIDDLGFNKSFKITKVPLEITYIPTGQRIIFRGANNPTSITSIEGMTDIIIEEAYEITDPETFRVLDGSIRMKDKDTKLQIIMCLNGWSDQHWIYQKFFKGRLEDNVEELESKGYQFYYDPDYIGDYGTGLALMKSSYICNPWRDVENYDRAMQEMKKKDYERYLVEGLGCWGRAGTGVYPAFNDSCLIPVQEALKLPYMLYAVGIDTGLSTAEGKVHKVGKDEDPNARVRSATTMVLMGITQGYRDIVILDEYYHTNISTNFNYNTDKDIHPGAMTQPELMAYMCVVLQEWRAKYENYVNKPRGSVLFNGMTDIYFDSADLGGRQTMDLEARKQGIYTVRFFGGSKLPIRARVDFENALQHYGNFLVCKENCPNTIREFKNAIVGDKGEARADCDDHLLTALEYAYTPFWQDLIQRHNFKPH